MAIDTESIGSDRNSKVPLLHSPLLYKEVPLFMMTLSLVTHIITREVLMNQTHKYNVCSLQIYVMENLLYVEVVS